MQTDLSALNGPFSTTVLTHNQPQRSSESFSDYFQAASDLGNSEDTKTKDAGGEASLQEFMAYAKETPAQRLFTSWLSGQNITQQEYNTMPTEQKQKLVEEFERQEKQKLEGQMNISASQQTAAQV